MGQSNKAVITCAVTGVLTDPERFPVPVSMSEMAASAKEAFDAGATVMHLHFRSQQPGMGRFPSWEPEVATAVTSAVREACPGVIINMSTGVMDMDVSAPVACMRATHPEIAACNAGTLNYLKVRKDGNWAWPPMTFLNPVEKVQEMLDAMSETNTRPEFECFDVGIVRSVGLFVDAGMCTDPHYNFVMGVASGMPTDPDLLNLLLNYRKPGTSWEVTAIGRDEIWPLHQRAAELGGCLRTGVEDTFYLPDGSRARGNGDLIEALAACARNAGREVASPSEARAILGLA
jgi:3-keto-5-aminohexanoate cleavage enzyme